jgi:hypothetical protein
MVEIFKKNKKRRLKRRIKNKRKHLGYCFIYWAQGSLAAFVGLQSPRFLDCDP